MFGVKFVSESRKLFNFESVRRDLVFLLISFIDENIYLHVYVVSKRHTYNLTEFSYSEKFLHGKDGQKLIML